MNRFVRFGLFVVLSAITMGSGPARADGGSESDGGDECIMQNVDYVVYGTGSPCPSGYNQDIFYGSNDEDGDYDTEVDQGVSCVPDPDGGCVVGLRVQGSVGLRFTEDWYVCALGGGGFGTHTCGTFHSEADAPVAALPGVCHNVGSSCEST